MKFDRYIVLFMSFLLVFSCSSARKVDSNARQPQSDGNGHIGSGDADVMGVKVLCSAMNLIDGAILARDFEVKMFDSSQHSHYNFAGRVTLDRSGFANLEGDIPGDQIQNKLNGKVILMIEKTKQGIDVIRLAKISKDKNSLAGVIDNRSGDSAFGSLRSEPVGIGLALTKLNLMVNCKEAK